MRFLPLGSTDTNRTLSSYDSSVNVNFIGTSCCDGTHESTRLHCGSIRVLWYSCLVSNGTTMIMPNVAYWSNEALGRIKLYILQRCWNVQWKPIVTIPWSSTQREHMVHASWPIGPIGRNDARKAAESKMRTVTSIFSSVIWSFNRWGHTAHIILIKISRSDEHY